MSEKAVDLPTHVWVAFEITEYTAYGGQYPEAVAVFTNEAVGTEWCDWQNRNQHSLNAHVRYGLKRVLVVS